MRLRDRYDNDIEQFRAYDETYGVLDRLGGYPAANDGARCFVSLEQAWDVNPLTAGTTDPSDLSLVPDIHLDRHEIPECRGEGMTVDGRVLRCETCLRSEEHAARMPASTSCLMIRAKTENHIPNTMQQTYHILLAALRGYQRNLDDGDLLEIATNGGSNEAPTADEIDRLCEDLNLGRLELVPGDFVRRHARMRMLLVMLQAAMLPGGDDRRKLLEYNAIATPDEFDDEGEISDGDIYRISLGDSELARWRDMIDQQLYEVDPQSHNNETA
jgi:hypothetical protein